MKNLVTLACTLGLGALAAASLLSGLAEAQAGPYQYYAVTPCRVYDTRNGSALLLGVIGVGQVRRSDQGSSACSTDADRRVPATSTPIPADGIRGPAYRTL